jgi:predicted DNA-binding WGR domain protein/DNA polymerase III delta prime subunit
MSSFEDFLSKRRSEGGFSSEDLLVSFLPLLRQIIMEHENGWCAPLEGLATLQVEEARIWYPESKHLRPRNNTSALNKIDRLQVRAVEVLKKRRIEETEENETARNLEAGKHEEKITHPICLPGYIAWEHEIGHHDPLTDVYSLGIILAAMGCGLDLNDPDALQAFVENRENLFRLAPQLHPVIAKAIVRMTEPSRHKRIQNLPGILASLENYRDQDIDLEYDLARIKGFESSDPQTKQQIILHHLNERLFEISRRNRLLHFRQTMQTINLTEASVPLSFSLEHIRADQLLTWSADFRKNIRAGKTISLNHYLDFNETLYLPSVLDRIRGEARRDQSEYGFEQMRLVICFLNWANLKETPHEHYHSPLVLLPVRLNKKKGIRDTFTLELLSDHAEINPVIRHQFKQLYDINLPERLDLQETDLSAFYDYLHNCISASAPGITLNKIDRPRIDMVYDQAKRRLKSYRRRARLSGRGIRNYKDLDYSYDRANFHPLGIRLFSEYVRPSETAMDQIIADKPAPRHMISGGKTGTEEKSFYSLRTNEGSNPWIWEFDLCNVTLGNFRYRKMTLVRDYAELQQTPQPNTAFDATFSLVPRDVEDEDDEETPELEERYHVVPCDPTQAKAIALAQSGASYIIQGPPGTGKSQTITNLIADYVARGKRVLFVCEKRAAIDVVYLRLKQCGLDDLCCLIHDSQADKKSFVMDLKQCYEGLLKQTGSSGKYKRRRDHLIKMLRTELRPIQRFTDAMLDHPDACGAELRKILIRALALRDKCPDLSAIEREALPHYSIWLDHQHQIADLVDILRDIQPDGILANHPLRRLNTSITTEEHPLELITAQLKVAMEILPRINTEVTQLPVPESDRDTFAAAWGMISYAEAVAPLAELRLLPLLNPDSETSKQFCADAEKRSTLARALAEREAATANWTSKLDARETEWALQQAQALPKNVFKLFSPNWWKLRKVLKRTYDFSAHQIQPDWTTILTDLSAEHAATDELQQSDRQFEETFHVSSSAEEIMHKIQQVDDAMESATPSAKNLHADVLASTAAAKTIEALLQIAPLFTRAQKSLSAVLCDYEPLTFQALEEDCSNILDSLHELPEFLACLTELSTFSPVLAATFRSMHCTAEEIEAAMIDHSAEEVMRTDRRIQRFSETIRTRQIQRIDGMVKKMAQLNAETVRESVQENFLEHMRIASMPAAGMTPDQKKLKNHYNLGRRELEHEFGKSMRYKSIRDLVADDSGLVVRDLKPVWLMSPLSVSDTLPLNDSEFDVVIFDEASQITLEEAIPSIFRAKQAIVVGDEMQLPPTNFFSAKRSDDEQTLTLEDDGQTVEYDLDSNSFLNHAARNLQSRMLGWHYRSRSEALISFSNWAFYQGGLLTVPDEQLPAAGGRMELIAKTANDADAALEPLLNRAISFHYMENAVYEKRCNRMEADYIARLVRGLLVDKHGLSIGIVAFSEAQQAEINSALTRLSREDRMFSNLLDAELEREVDGQFVGLLVKNLENIQGDERDIVIMSVCYGHDAERRMRMNFGPINQSGGEKRLNVAFSRAKHHMVLVSSIRHSHITNDYNDGANCLKNYLRYAELTSVGDTKNATRLLGELSLWSNQAKDDSRRQNEVVVQQIAAALQERGWIIDIGVGMSHFRCDLGVRKETNEIYTLGIQVDTDEYYAQDDLIERDLMKPSLLKAFGWRIAHVLTCDWFRDREAVVDRLEKRLAGDEAETPSESRMDLDALLAETETADLNTTAPTIQKPSGTAQGSLAEKQTIRFESHSDASSRFWEITWVSNEYSVHFGRIGTNGQSHTKSFESTETAQREANKIIRQKLRKGYQQV